MFGKWSALFFAVTGMEIEFFGIGRLKKTKVYVLETEYLLSVIVLS